MSAAAPSSSSGTDYRIVSRFHVNKWSDDFQAVVPGWEVKALWIKTGTVLPIFVPDASYSADTVDKLIRHAGAVDESIHSLGG